MKRFVMNVDQCGALYADECERGEWCRFEDHEVEIARLREELNAAHEREKLAQLHLGTERAAHEATKSALVEVGARTDEDRIILQLARESVSAHNELVSSLAKSQQRVAELEQRMDIERKIREGAVGSVCVMQSALSSARDLLEYAMRALDDDGLVLMAGTIRAWFRDHPEPATPAATGAERQHCSQHAGWRSDCEQCAEKETE